MAEVFYFHRLSEIQLRSDYGADNLRALARASVDSVQTRRLLSLAEIYDGGSRGRAGCVSAGLVLPRCNTIAMNLRLKEISIIVAPKAHAIVIVDQAG